MWNVKLKFKNEEDKVKVTRIVKWFLHLSEEKAKTMVDNGEIPCYMIESASTLADGLSIIDDIDISIHYER